MEYKAKLIDPNVIRASTQPAHKDRSLLLLPDLT
ncbi:hypothetical protein QF014_000407 [Pantoea agglomerans]|nr:hypothetical protein [Pantoea agglomerans]